VRIPHFGIAEGATTAEPVTWSDFATHSRIDSTGERTLIESYLTAARILAEDVSHRALMQRTVTLTLDKFPAGRRILELPRPPLTSVTSISYVDTGGATTAMASTNYVVDTASRPGRLQPTYNTVWPTARDQLGAVTITYVAGATTSTNVAETDKQAIRMLVGHWFQNREAVGTLPNEIAFAFNTLVRAKDLGDLW
jgi:uncharacterized phiE125 gp8 family phage protein